MHVPCAGVPQNLQKALKLGVPGRLPADGRKVEEAIRGKYGVEHIDFVVTLLTTPGETVGRLERQTNGGTVASVCSGADVLGAAGLLNGRRCTTHHAIQDDLAAEPGDRIALHARPHWLSAVWAVAPLLTGAVVAPWAGPDGALAVVAGRSA